MRAVVVYESMFGNTQAIANSIAEGLSSRLSVEVAEVSEAPSSIGDDVALLVVGGPTHVFGMSRPGTRQDAARQADHPVVSPGGGLREWLAELHFDQPGTLAATFDTRVTRPRFGGSAAGRAQKRLGRLGCRMLTGATSFFVTATPGPLADGELERARQWGEQLGSQLLTQARQA